VSGCISAPENRFSKSGFRDRFRPPSDGCTTLKGSFADVLYCTAGDTPIMKIAIASGKGGTGKTTIATNLASSIARVGQTVQYLDCDVEDCQYSAIICIKDTVLTFEELCHACGGCMAICPEGAITEKQRKIGVTEFGKADGIYFGHGKLNIGAVQTPTLIRHLKRRAMDDAVVVIDAPPGTSCPVIEAVKGSDLVLLVTEPTPFGLNDLELAVEMVRALELPFAVAINRCDIGDDRVVRYCRQEDIEIVLKMPNDRLIAEAYSTGIKIIDALPGYEEKFSQLYERIRARVGAYRRAAMKYHPDHNRDDPEANQKFTLVKCAYELLANNRPCDKLLDEIASWSSAAEDEKYNLDNLWGHFLWWREKFFD